MHPINNKFFGTAGLAVKFYNGTATVTGYIVRQLGTNRFVVSDGTHTVTAYLVSTLAEATNLGNGTIIAPPDGNTVSGAFQMTIPVPFAAPTAYVTHIYENRIDTINGSGTTVLNWSLGTAFDGSTALETYATASAPVYAAGAHGGLTTLTFATAPETSATHGTATFPVLVATLPVAPSSDVMDLYLSTSATVLPTTGAIANSSYSAGTFGFTAVYASAGTYYAWCVLSDSSYLISSALVIA